MSFSTSSMADLPSFSTEEIYWLASCFWGIITCKLWDSLIGFWMRNTRSGCQLVLDWFWILFTRGIGFSFVVSSIVLPLLFPSSLRGGCCYCFCSPSEFCLVSQLPRLCFMIGSMDSGNCASKCKANSPKLIKNSDKVCTDEINRVIIDPSATTRQGNKESSLGSITPDANRGIGEFPYKFNSPPTEVKKAQNHPHFDPDTTINQESMVSVNHSSPRTPKDGIFDPFAPGSECMVFAPSYRKYVDEMRITVARRPNFDISVGTVGYVNHISAAVSISDEEMF
ncbi:hypothetical protein J1N35_042495 [Gossypium stocksii]|uniref:Uncharacterized protein n=1 Tax=Gossypium stocksii TaxID=47602 RepID=A0A9D3ZKC6_9ROSI|nr:hypothetical protein J1N35_042495 [Gossypium stocksii]